MRNTTSTSFRVFPAVFCILPDKWMNSGFLYPWEPVIHNEVKQEAIMIIDITLITGIDFMGMLSSGRTFVSLESRIQGSQCDGVIAQSIIWFWCQKLVFMTFDVEYSGALLSCKSVSLQVNVGKKFWGPWSTCELHRVTNYCGMRLQCFCISVRAEFMNSQYLALAVQSAVCIPPLKGKISDFARTVLYRE